MHLQQFPAGVGLHHQTPGLIVHCRQPRVEPGGGDFLGERSQEASDRTIPLKEASQPEPFFEYDRHHLIAKGQPVGGAGLELGLHLHLVHAQGGREGLSERGQFIGAQFHPDPSLGTSDGPTQEGEDLPGLPEARLVPGLEQDLKLQLPGSGQGPQSRHRVEIVAHRLDVSGSGLSIGSAYQVGNEVGNEGLRGRILQQAGCPRQAANAAGNHQRASPCRRFRDRTDGR